MKQWLAVISIAWGAGCAHHAATTTDHPVATSAPQASSSDQPPNRPPAAMGNEPCAVDKDCGKKQLCIRAACVDVTDNLAECGILRVHFALNSSEIDVRDKEALDRSARCLKGDYAMHVSIAGNADERGTEDYNLALGDRRATAVAVWLQSVGVSSLQMKTVSYGKERPLCPEHDEACWAKNRRTSVRAN